MTTRPTVQSTSVVRPSPRMPKGSAELVKAAESGEWEKVKVRRAAHWRPLFTPSVFRLWLRSVDP
jgi:hypothetical protein